MNGQCKITNMPELLFESAGIKKTVQINTLSLKTEKKIYLQFIMVVIWLHDRPSMSAVKLSIYQVI
jgi:hypothetical protein